MKTPLLLLRNPRKTSALPVVPFALVSLIAGLALAQDQTANPELLHVKTVYLLPMHFGFDQYLANELTRTGAVRIVIDPTKADAIFADRLNEAVEQKLESLAPAPEPSAQSKKPADAAADAAKNTDASADSESKPAAEGKPAAGKQPKKSDGSLLSIFDAPDTSATHPQTSFSSGRGNVFLIDKNTRTIIWSFYEAPRSAQPPDLRHSADRVAVAFKRALQGKPEHQ